MIKAQVAVLIMLGLVLGYTQSCCDSNTLKVTGNAEVKVKPDIATVTISAKSTAKTTSEALSNVNKQIASVISILNKQGIKEGDYSTSALTISQEYDYSSGEQTVVGQTASESLSVKIRDISSDGAAIGKLIDAVSGINGISISGVTFEQSDKSLGVKQARKAAYQSAKRKAEEYAQLSDLRVRRVLRISAVGGNNYVPYQSTGYIFGADQKTAVPIKNVTISESVDVVFSLLP